MKIKKILSLLAATTVAITALTGAMSVSAAEVVDTGTCGDVKWSFDSSTGKLTISGQGEMGSPDNVEQLTAYDEFTNFYEYKNKYKEYIKEVIIEDGVASIGYGAFCKLPNLKSVSIPSSVKKFDNRYINVLGILGEAFADCTSLKNVELADGLSCIGATAFRGCTSLESVVIPASIKDFGQKSFMQCTSLKEVTLSEGLTVLGGAVFRNSGLESVHVPSSIEKWEISQGYGGGNGEAAFAHCESLKSVTFGDGVKEIGANAFALCKSLEEIAFGDDSELTTLDSKVFYGCENLKRIEIPDNFTSFGNDCFAICTSAEEIYIYSKNVSAYSLPYKNKNAKAYCYNDSNAYDNISKDGFTPYDISSVISSKLEELNTAVSEAEKYPEKDYTAESYGKLKTLLDEAATKNNESHVLGLTYLTEDIYTAIKGLEKKPPEDNTSGKESDSSNSQQQTPNKTTPQTPTTARPTKSTRSAAQVKKDKSAAKKAMKQAKITKLTAKSKAKKKITVSWKKVKNAKGYQVQVSAKKNFKKVIYNKSLAKNKLTIKSSKIKSKKTYYVRVRAYATYKDANNATKKIYSKWVKKIRKVKAK